jgi:predicted heme/steroid binding protein
MYRLTLAELSSYNGRDGSPAFVAFRGLIYDVSASYYFRNGRHWIEHNAGCDLTEEIARAPHTDALLMKFPVVGTLTIESGAD